MNLLRRRPKTSIEGEFAPTSLLVFLLVGVSLSAQTINAGGVVDAASFRAADPGVDQDDSAGVDRP